MRSNFPNALSLKALLAGASVLLAASVSSAAVVDVYLRAERYAKALPGGASVPTWRFVCDTAYANPNCAASASGAPRINAGVGDSLNVHLANTLPTRVSVLIPGQAGGGDPTFAMDGKGRNRARSFTKETGIGSVGTPATQVYTWPSLRAGTYLFQSGTRPSIQVPMGLFGALVVGPATLSTGSCAAGQQAAYDDVDSCADAEALLLFSEIDPVQNAAVDLAGDDATKYPATVDYSPRYFLINGTPYDRTTPPPALPVGAPGSKALLRLVNVGLRTHAPAVVGLEMGLVAEDGHVYPGLTRKQASALLPAGKTLDAILTAPATNATYPVFDRMLDLTNDNQPQGGMLAYLQVGTGSSTPPSPTTYAVNDTYAVTEDTPLSVGGVGVLANDVGLAGATVSLVSGAANGLVTLNANGSFTYTPNADFSGADGFTYSASLGGASYPAQVTLNVSFVNDPPVAGPDGPFVNTIGPTITVAAPGVLGNDTDPDGDPLTATLVGSVPGLTLNSNGSFTYTGGTSLTFSYRASDGAAQSAPVSVILQMNPLSNIALDVRDPLGAPVSSYRWLVQEDATYHIDPATPPTPSATLSTNFHKSYMPVVAQGCLGAACNAANPSIPLAAFSQAALDPAKQYYVSVLPNDAGTGTGHSIGAARIPLPRPASPVKVVVNNQPIPTAQISVIIFEDNSPTNGVPDPTEPRLGGFQISLEDAAGRYGQAGGSMSQDAYGNPLKNSLDCFGGSPPPAGVILTCPDGTALIKDLPPGKYGVFAVAPPGAGRWTQTSTIEGTKIQDTWVKAGEPPFLVEFGAPGYHAFIGFVNPEHTKVPDSIPPGLRRNTITGNVTMSRPARPPSQALFDSGSYDALAHTRAWVGLNSNAGNGANFSTVQAAPDGSFSMTGIPDGTYQLAIWDEYLDQIITYQTVTVPGGGNVGNIPVPTWFGRHEHNVFLDNNGNGRRDPGEPGLPDQNVNLRFRDGTVFQSYPTDTEGFVPFDQVFPFGAWQVAEVDYTRFKPTGVTVTVDGGGDVSGGPYPGLLNPQVGSPRTDTQPAPVLLEGFQSMPGMTSIFEWGKKPYAPGENGGIAGIVFYASTRGENDPRLTVGDPWEPGIPGVTVRLHREVERSDGTKGWAFVAETRTDSWDAANPTGCLGEPAGNPFVTQTLQGNATRCFDGIRNWEQVRPAVFDGGYFFGDLAPGKYRVEVVPPPGYEIYKEEDKNVDFGDGFATAPVAVMLPGGAVVLVAPDQAMVAAAMAAEPGLAQPPCVGPTHVVPNELSLFPGVETYAPFAGAERPLCSVKEVVLSDQSQAAADFHLFTSTPVAGQFHGLTTDDIAIETNPASPNFGDKWGPAFMPVSMRDFKGQEIYRGYTDAFGRYNGLVPSTFSANIPVPSGYSPAMHQVCLNDPGPIQGPGGTSILDPQRNPSYGTFCYTLMYMPGTTSYLDTPLLPQGAFAAGTNPVDCAPSEGTPVIAWVDGSGAGPLVAPGGTLTIHSQGSVAVPNPAYEGPLGTAPATIVRNYGFGTTAGSVTLNGIALSCGWGDTTLTCPVPSGFVSAAYQLVVTRADGKSSTNAVTVTVGNETPIRVTPGAGAIQTAIDGAAPGSLILVAPGTYEELLVLWKPVRLQGSGAATFLNAVKRPPERLDAWRQKVEGLINAGTIDLVPGQPAQFDLVGAGLLGTELGAGITVLAKNDGSFLGQPSRIDGFTISGADGGGAIFVNGYAHNLVISNNQITGNSGVLHGGIRIGHPYLPQVGNGPFGYNRNVSIHHNAITLNGAQSDTAVGGGLALCTGSDNYRVSSNYVCGNFTLGDGGGIGHLGLSNAGVIDSNRILFNQSFNQGVNRSGGGLLIAGEPPAGGALTLGAGNVSVDANLIQGNQAGSGHGGGIRTQLFNGVDVQLSNQPTSWYQLRITNNMIVNNVAGWSGGGISLQDTVNASIVLNTIANNDSTGTAGAVVGAGPQPAGISSERNSAVLDAAIPGNQSSRRNFSNPVLTHNIVWHNRAFTYDVNNPRLLPVLSPTTVGGCAAGADYRDLGVLDPNPAFTLSPQFSILTVPTGGGNITADPQFLSGYCNGARTLSTPGPIQVTAEPAEGGTFIDVRYGPLTTAWPATNGPWNYHIASTSPAIDRPGTQPSGANVSHDFDGQVRPTGPRVDLGADEVVAGGGSAPGTVAATSATLGTLTPTELNFGARNGNVSSTVTFTVGGGSSVTFGTAVVSGSSRFTKGADTCSGTTRAPGATCTVTINFNASGNTPRQGTLTVPHNGASSPLTLGLLGQ